MSRRFIALNQKNSNEATGDISGLPSGKLAFFVNKKRYYESDFDQKYPDMSCLLYAVSACISEQLFFRTESSETDRMEVLPRVIYD